MALIRVFEERAAPLARAGKIPGGMHSAAGQEAVAIGAVRALKPTDIVTSTHRSHHHSLAKGLQPREIMAELYGKAGGLLGGRAGHLHLADFSRGLFGSNGIVGAGLGIATGAAVGAKLRGRDQVAVGFFGDGGANTGRTWENVNLAASWGLPLIAICENNLYAVETHLAAAAPNTTIADRAAGFGLHSVQVDGQDVVAMHDGRRGGARAGARRRRADLRRGAHLPLQRPHRRRPGDLPRGRGGRAVAPRARPARARRPRAGGGRGAGGGRPRRRPRARGGDGRRRDRVRRVLALARPGDRGRGRVRHRSQPGGKP